MSIVGSSRRGRGTRVEVVRLRAGYDPYDPGNVLAGCGPVHRWEAGVIDPVRVRERVGSSSSIDDGTVR